MEPLSKPNKIRCENPNFRCYGKVIYRTPKQAEGEARYTKIKGLWGGEQSTRTFVKIAMRGI